CFEEIRRSPQFGISPARVAPGGPDGLAKPPNGSSCALRSLAALLETVKSVFDCSDGVRTSSRIAHPSEIDYDGFRRRHHCRAQVSAKASITTDRTSPADGLPRVD